MFSLTEGTDVVVNYIDDYVWEYEDDQTGALNEKLMVGIDSVCKFVQFLCSWRIVDKINIIQKVKIYKKTLL